MWDKTVLSLNCGIFAIPMRPERPDEDLFFLYKRIFAALPDREKPINQRDIYVCILKNTIHSTNTIENVSLMRLYKRYFIWILLQL